MAGPDVVSLYNKYRLLNFVGVDDWADRLSYAYSFIILLGCTVLISSKTYLLRPIACHMPTAPEGANFKNYVEAACWVLGTIPLRKNETIPQEPSDWAKLAQSRRINYYQWVPFMLGLQCIMFYLPRLAWQTVSFNRLGTDLNQLVAKANEALVAKTDEKRHDCIEQAARSLELLLFAHRDYRQGVLADLKRRVVKVAGFLLASKRLGTWTVFAYFCIKLAYLTNAIVQLYAMMIFLNYDRSLFQFGLKLLRNLLSETYWTETLYFPRLAYCPLQLSHLGARQNFYTGICALPINMLNEKIYIFLFFWIMFVMFCTAFSILVWIVRMSIRHNRTALIQKYLRLKPPARECTQSEHSLDASSFRHSDISRKSIDSTERRNVKLFVTKFLRIDGVFLIHVLTANAGDVVTGEIVALLWRAWVSRYAGRADWEFPSDDSDSDMQKASSLENEYAAGGSSLSAGGASSTVLPGLRRRQYDVKGRPYS